MADRGSAGPIDAEQSRVLSSTTSFNNGSIVAGESWKAEVAAVDNFGNGYVGQSTPSEDDLQSVIASALLLDGVSEEGLSSDGTVGSLGDGRFEIEFSLTTAGYYRLQITDGWMSTRTILRVVVQAGKQISINILRRRAGKRRKNKTKQNKKQRDQNYNKYRRERDKKERDRVSVRDIDTHRGERKIVYKR